MTTTHIHSPEDTMTSQTTVGRRCDVCGQPATTRDGIVGADLCDRQECLDAVTPTPEEGISWGIQLDVADQLNQRLQGILDQAYRAAHELLRKADLRTGSGPDGYLNQRDLEPLFAALQIRMRP